MSPNSAITPVYFFSHGSTMMLGEESQSATYWKKAGDEALANNIKGVIMMVSYPASSRVSQPA
jgi:aromatic ring-opening dioxygenase catalytic subunit (LigB family)